MPAKLRCAVIGVGNMGKHHARIYSQIAQLVSVADPVEAAGKLIADTYHAHYYRDFREMLHHETIDAVSVAVPTKFHEEISVYCLQKYIPTLVEKPMSNSVQSATRIIETAKKENVLLMVGHVERFNPAVIRLKKLIDEGIFGQIVSLNSVRVGINPPPTPSSNVAIDLGIHDVDIFNFLLGEIPIESNVIKGKIFEKNISDSASFLLRYKHATGTIQTNWMTPIKIRKLYITGTDGFAELDYITQTLVLYKHYMHKMATSNFKELVSLAKIPKKQIYISKKEPLREELVYFLALVRKKKVLYPEFAL